MLKMVAVGGLAVLAALAFQPGDARADTSIDVGVGGGWSPAPDDSEYPVYDPDDDYDDEDEYISCREGRRIVRDYGFYEVRPTRCGGAVYRYEAIKRDQLWSVRVSARSGRIISAREVDDY